ncbi:MAG: hypothetical protein LBE01_03840, partial [Deltaproteobacteria bacterium]|nr:hypothetical protein [Deltaproteobacteria bacterium]
RLAYVILKNSGYAELTADKAFNASSLLADSPFESEAYRRLSRLKVRLSSKPEKDLDNIFQSSYLGKILEKL